ncbi:zinc finger protein 135-like [Lytechinus pictus]|uniref:zinc finger protein 135-like n=1 Tax=Lytechinus pictus TaxID=7653 RepID=UPI0030B9CE8E
MIKECNMDPSYRQGFYPSGERDKDQRHPPNTLHHPQLQQQHLQHYQIPFHISPQQPPFMVDQVEPLRNREEFGNGQVMLRSIYTGSVHPNANTSLQASSDHPVNYSPGLQHVTLLQPTTQSSGFPSSTSPTTCQAGIFTPPPVITSDHTPVITPLDPAASSGIISKEQPDAPNSLTSAHLRLQSITAPTSTFPSTISSIRQTVLSHPTIVPPNTTSQSRTPNILTPSSALQKNLFVSQSVFNSRGRKSREKSKGEEKTPGADLPDFLHFKFDSDDKENIRGVIATGLVEKGTMFGPYEGNLLDEDSGAPKESTWELCLRGKVFLYIDGKGKGRSHMMSYVQCARNESEQNLEAIQSFGDVYFRAMKTIEPGDELKVFYSEVYSDLVGFQMKLDDLIYHEDDNEFECKQCSTRLPSAKRMLRHVKFDHETDSSKELCPIVTWMVKAKTDVENISPSSEQANEKEDSTEPSKHYTCTVCGKNFPTEGRLEAHAMFHEFTEDHTCPVCGERQRNTFMLTKHMARHVIRTHKCSKCDKAYKTRGALYRHERDMHGIPVVRNHRCRICPIRFAKKLECLKHEMTHREFKDVVGTPKKRACKMNIEPDKRITQTKNIDDNIENIGRSNSVGEERLSIPEEEEIHNASNKTSRDTERLPMQPRNRKPKAKAKGKPQEPQDMLGKAADYYIKPRPFKCRYCSKRYVDKTKAYEHEKEVHEGKGTYKCTDCGRMFMNEARFLDHVKNHEQHRLYRCNLCARSFASETALNNHQGEHNGLKPYKCDLCGRGFRVKNAVYQHKRRMHQTRQMRFFCTVCNKGFPDKGGLTKHERRHKGIRPFVCLVCGKGFTVKHSLQVHMQSMHEEKRPFTCHICLKTFSLNHSFTSHMFRHKIQGGEPSEQSQQQQQS